ncbi:MAG: GLUG motif-containing protein [Planctomycetota bacterium]
MSELTKRTGIILICCLIFQSSSLSAEFAGGTGEPNDPYQIATAEQFISIGLDGGYQNKHYILIEDIDLDPNLPDGRIFTNSLIAHDESDSPDISHYTPFFGVLDGQNHTIANLHIEAQHGYSAGLFGSLDGLVKDLHLTDVVISGSPCGVIAGVNQGMILRCSVTGQVSGSEDVGGLVGSSSLESSLVECQAQVQVTGGENIGGMVGRKAGILMRCEAQAEVSGQQNVGGLVGVNSRGRIIESRATGIVTGGDIVGGLIGESRQTFVLRSSAICDVTTDKIAGGLTGQANWWSLSCLFSDCYFQGSIAGSTIGGLVGEPGDIQVLNCYAACEFFPLRTEGGDPVIGGLFGETSIPEWAPITENCFWDTALSGITTSTGSHSLELGTGLTTEQMMDEEVFRNAGWDFSYVWMISEGEYPKLQWEGIENEAVVSP